MQTNFSFRNLTIEEIIRIHVPTTDLEKATLERLQYLEANYNETSTEIEDLNTQIDDLEWDLGELKEQIEAKDEEIKRLKEDLEHAQNKIQNSKGKTNDRLQQTLQLR